jgi:predicted DNA-binding WGR domain protein
VLTREWGRIGSGGTVRLEHYPTSDAATAALNETVRLKEKRGYEFPNHS